MADLPIKQSSHQNGMPTFTHEHSVLRLRWRIHTCVLLPQPVDPSITTVGFVAIFVKISDWAEYIGNNLLSEYTRSNLYFLYNGTSALLFRSSGWLWTIFNRSCNWPRTSSTSSSNCVAILPSSTFSLGSGKCGLSHTIRPRVVPWSTGGLGGSPATNAFHKSIAIENFARKLLFFFKRNENCRESWLFP